MTGPTLTPRQACVLLLVSLEGSTATEIADRLAQRGQLLDPGTLWRTLNALTAAGLLVQCGTSGRAVYQLATGEEVEEALDLAHSLVHDQP